MMARYNEIQVGRFNRFLQKLLSMKGEVPAPTLSGDIQPIIPVEFNGVENRYLLSWDRFGDERAVPAIVGQPSVLELRNPSGSNVIAVFEKITIIVTAVAERFVLLTGALGTDGTVLTPSTLRLDPRGRSNTTLILSLPQAGIPAGPANKAGTAGVVNAASDFILNPNQEIPLLPGDALVLANVTNNASFRAGYIWRERFLEDSERA